MGWKAKKIDIFRLKHRNLRPICMCLVCHSHGFAALKHYYCQPISMLLHKKQASKRIEKPIIPYNKLIHKALQKQPHISHIYSKQGCCSQIRQRWRGVCQEKGQLKFYFEHGRFGSVWWNGYGAAGARLRAERDELRLYVWSIFWCVRIVTCCYLPQRKMPLNY